MDTSETYIKMRLAAIPDLGQGTPPQLAHGIGDDIVAPVWLNDVAFIDHKGDVYYSVWSAGGCQLERQDQLQAIYNDGHFGLQTLCCFLYDFCISSYGSGFTISGSMEQLWLAFVMKELHSKSWTGTEWQ